MIDEAKQKMDTAGPAAAAEFLTAQPDGEPLLQALLDLLMHAYWQRKDLAAVITVAEAGMARCQTIAQNAGHDSELGRKALRVAQMLAYNLASFAWAGWDEPGITIGPAERRIGLEAARRSQQLVEELKLGELPLARGTWMVGVHHLAAGNHRDAELLLRQSEVHARAAGSADDEKLARGFAQLAALLASPADPALAAALEETKSQLAAAGDDGKEYARQIETAERLWRPGALAR